MLLCTYHTGFNLHHHTGGLSTPPTPRLPTPLLFPSKPDMRVIQNRVTRYALVILSG
jgi:hypothetical protein